MIDEKKIEEAAGNFIEYLPYYEKDGKNLYDENSVITAFKEGINWFLDNLWHDASKVPDRVKEILLEQEINGKKQHQAYMFNGASFFREHCRKCGVTRWLYIEDLMKGGK